MMLWLFFANLFDPKRIIAIEQLETAERIGNPVVRDAATPAAPPTTLPSD